MLSGWFPPRTGAGRRQQCRELLSPSEDPMGPGAPWQSPMTATSSHFILSYLITCYTSSDKYPWKRLEEIPFFFQIF